MIPALAQVCKHLCPVLGGTAAAWSPYLRPQVPTLRKVPPAPQRFGPSGLLTLALFPLRVRPSVGPIRKRLAVTAPRHTRSACYPCSCGRTAPPELLPPTRDFP
jgi:hypothetical protein